MKYFPFSDFKRVPPARQGLYRQLLRGFTLIELLVTIAMVAILAALAAPGLRTFIVQNQMASLSNEFLAAATLARTEAIKAGPGKRATMAAEGGDWKDGWRIYVDQDSSGDFNGGDREIRRHEGLDPNLAITDNLKAISYNAGGEAETFVMGSWNRVSTATISFCLDGVVRAVVFTRIGRPRLEVEKRAKC